MTSIQPHHIQQLANNLRTRRSVLASAGAGLPSKVSKFRFFCSRAASEAALDLAGAGHQLDTTASWLAVLLAIAVAAPPIMAIGMPWLYLRIRFFRRKWTVIALAQTTAGVELLALRALANRPLRKLTAVSADPVGAWRQDDPVAVRGLAELELRSAGVAAPRYWRAPAV